MAVPSGTEVAHAEAPGASDASQGSLVLTRALKMFLLCMIVVGVLALALIQGVIPVQFGLSGAPFKLSVEKLSGTSITGYVGTSESVDDGTSPMVLAGVEGGTGENLCLSTVLDLPVLNQWSVTITSGSSKPVEFDQLTADGGALHIDAVTLTDAELGLDAATLDSELLDAPMGAWGLRMGSAEVDNIRIAGEDMEAASLRLRGLGLKLQRGTHECFTAE